MKIQQHYQSSLVLLVLCCTYLQASGSLHHGSSNHHAWGKKQPSSFGVTEMTWALRWTGEVNRQLHQTTQTTTAIQSNLQYHDHGLLSSLSEPSLPTVQSPSSLLLVRGGSDQQQQQLQQNNPILQDGNDGSLTDFHAKSPMHAEQTGAARWGPPLASFLERALKVLLGHNSDAHEQERILMLSLLYMDRASSVSTPRSQRETSHALPFCTPRTVHRLTLSSLILAVSSSVHNVSPQMYCQRVAAAFGMCPEQLYTMVLEMKHALGDFGALVTPLQYRQFQEAWLTSPVLRQLSSSSQERRAPTTSPVAVAH